MTSACSRQIDRTGNDSAAYYLFRAGPRVQRAALQPQSQEIYRRLTQAAHCAIDQRRFATRIGCSPTATDGVPAATIANLQRDLGRAAVPSRGGSRTAAVPRSRAIGSQGEVTEPDNDSALYYVNSCAGDRRTAAAEYPRRFRGNPDQARAALDAAAGESRSTAADAAAWENCD